MPVYEYVCSQCDARFSLLQPMSAPRDGNECPECGSRGTRRIMSSFAAKGAGGSQAGGCGPSGSPFR